MALTHAQKQHIVKALATETPMAKIAKDLNVGRTTVWRFSKSDECSVMANTSAIATVTTAVATVTESDLSASFRAIAANEEWIEDDVLKILKTAYKLLGDILTKTSADDISPRQIPQMITGINTLTMLYYATSDRRTGLQVLSDEIIKLQKIGYSA